jgi:hypothetical protein
MITIAALVGWFLIALVVNLLGLTPEQQAAAGLKRQQRDAERQLRASERAFRQQQRHWQEIVARQRVPGDAGFASDAEAADALNSRGGRPSAADRHRF